ncbi:MAG TPA: hypothetical protein VH369_01485 [Bryobacteraceae bacterium]|jgi:predicted nucleotidyltransferase
MPERKLVATLRALEENKVAFVLVGGLAAVLNGVPIQTYDVDVVYSRDPANIQRLLVVLDSLEAIFRIQPERRLKPQASHLEESGHLNLLTRYGPLDLLAAIGRGLAYADLLPCSSVLDIADGVRIPVLNLETLIAVKEQTGGEKDLAVLPILRRTLAEYKKRSR